MEPHCVSEGSSINSSSSRPTASSPSATNFVDSAPKATEKTDTVTSARARAISGLLVLRTFANSLRPSNRPSVKRKVLMAKIRVNTILLDHLPISRIVCGDDFCLVGQSDWIDAYTTRFKASEKSSPKLPKSDRDHWARVMTSDRSRLPKGKGVSYIRSYTPGYHSGVSIAEILLERTRVRHRRWQVPFPAEDNTIYLVIAYKGYPVQVHKVLSRCDCGKDRDHPNGTFITRDTLTKLVAFYYKHLFATFKPTEESGTPDMSLPEHFSRLRLLFMWSLNERTWHAHVGYVTHEKAIINKDGIAYA